MNPQMCLKGIATTVLVLAVMTVFAVAQVPIERVQKVENGRNAGSRPSSGPARYSYVFENERFTTQLIEVTFDNSGRGKFHFKRKDGQDVTNDLKVSSSVVSQIRSLFDESNFLGTDEDYQHKKDFSHLGTVTLGYSDGARERKTSFNYSDNVSMNRLVDLFRNIATQENRVFEIEVTRENDPISMPAQMRMLESELKSKQIADPHQLVSLLEQLKIDEAIPLIARNHADRLLKSIAKAKS